MMNVFNIYEKSSKYTEELNVLTKVLETVLHESNYPICGALLISISKGDTAEKLLDLRIGSDIGIESLNVAEQNLQIYADLCEEVLDCVIKATLSRNTPEGLHRFSSNSPRSLFFCIGNTRLHIVYFATYDGPSTGKEIERVYLVIAEILRRQCPDNHHIAEKTREVIEEIVSQRDVYIEPGFLDTLAIIKEELN